MCAWCSIVGRISVLMNQSSKLGNGLLGSCQCGLPRHAKDGRRRSVNSLQMLRLGRYWKAESVAGCYNRLRKPCSNHLALLPLLLRLPNRAADSPYTPDQPTGRNSCVPAAVQMVLAVQGIVLGEEALCALLETQPVGTEGLHVLLLNQRLAGCHAAVVSASFDDLRRWLQEGIPPMVLVATGPLHYWHTECLHALVVAGIAEQSVMVHDPACAQAPITIPQSEFLAAWGELAQLTALIRVSGTE